MSLFILLIILGFSSLALTLGQQPIISFTSGALHLASTDTIPNLILSTSDFPGVLRAAQDLSADFGRVTGKNTTVITGNFTSTDKAPSSGPVIIVGTIGKSELVDSLFASGKIDISTIEGRWESFQTQVVTDPMPGLSSALVISGSDKRGTIYGIYDISEQIGVSPWYWFADVPTSPQTDIYALDGIKTQGPPTVKYRGIFLNDEQPSLTNWVDEKYGGVGFISGFYTRVFELLLRLRANYLWPTMWNSMFAVDDAENQPLADMYGIVMGTSHTEPLMRSTKEQSTYLTGAWDWSSNKENIITFLTEGVKRAKPYESLYTMGMRGSGDTASPTLTAASLADVVASEQSILASVLETNLSVIPQMWCLYKEVGGYYQEGLTVPDDITLLWSDDNWGNIQRLPIKNETSRAGGAGIYYHFDYVGAPRDYKWINTIQLQKTWEQMHLAYERDATGIWVVNVGDLKPLELPMSHFLDMAYDMSLYDSPNSTSTWLSQWATREFGTDLAASVASIMNRYGQYAARRKYELLDAAIYSIVNYNEADNVLNEWKTLVSDAQTIYNSLSATTQPAYFELVLHPCKAGYILHSLYIATTKNNLYAQQGRVSAATYGATAVDAFSQDAALATQYHQLLGGKWNHMMDQTHIGYTDWQEPASNNMPTQSYPPHNTNSPPGIFLEGGSTTLFPPISPYGPSTRWLDIYSKSNTTTKFSITSPSWITTTPSSGSLNPPGLTSDARIQISVNWKLAPNGTSNATLAITAGESKFTVTLPLQNRAVPSDFHGFVESDGVIVIEAEHFTSSTASAEAGYSIIPGYGPTLSGVSLFPVTIPSQAPPNSPKLTYNLFIFTPTTASITLSLGPALNSDPSRPLKYFIALDGESPTPCQYVPLTDLGTLPDGWSDMVESETWTYTTQHEVGMGEHVLSLWIGEPGVVVRRLVVDLGGERECYLGPGESLRV